MAEENPYLAQVRERGDPTLVPANDAEQNPYLSQIRERKRLELTASSLETEKYKPEQAAEALTLGKASGIPAAVAIDNLDELRSEQRQRDIERIGRESPTLAQWLTTPENMGVAKDDLDGLSAFENVMRRADFPAEIPAKKPDLQPLSESRGFAQASSELRQQQDTEQDNDILSHYIMQGASYRTAKSNLDWLKSQRGAAVASGKSPAEADDQFAAGVLTPIPTAKESTFDFEGRKQFEDANMLTRGAVKGAAIFNQQMYGFNSFLADTFLAGGGQYGEFLKRKNAASGKIVEETVGMPADSLSRNFEGAVSSIISQAPFLVSGAATGSQAAVLAPMFAQVFGQEYADGKSAGLDYSERVSRAGIFGMAEVIGEKFGLSALLKGLKGAAAGVPTSQLAKYFGEAFAKEIPGEQLTTAIQFGTDKFLPQGLTQGATLAHYIQQASDTLVQTVMQGGLMTGGGVAVGKTVNWLGGTNQIVVEQMRKEDAGRRAAEFFAAVDAAADAKKLRELSPEKDEELTAAQLKAVGRETVYMPIEAYQTYYQAAGFDPGEAWTDMTGDRIGYDEALASGADLQIPYAKYLTRLSEEERKLLTPNLKLEPDGLSATELESADNQIEELIAGQDIEAEKAAAERAKESATEADDLKKLIADDLVATGRYDESAAKVYAETFFSRYQARAKLRGKAETAMQAYQASKAQITREMPGQALRLVDTDIDPLLDELRSGNPISDSQAAGPSLLAFLRSKGGLQDQGGELAVLDAKKADAALRKPGERKLVNPDGLTLDAAREAAVEAGYLPPDDLASPSTSDIRGLTEAIDRELRGEPVYSEKEGNAALQQRRQQLADLDEALGRAGIDLKTATNEQVREALRGSTYEQGSIPTDTAAFKNWFGDSKVVDAEGKPLVVYHGTRSKAPITEFRAGTAPGWGRGIYFTDNAAQAASEFGDKGQVIQAFVSIKNPYRDDPLTDEMLEATQAWRDTAGRWKSGADAFQEDSKFVGDVLRELGYDGVISKDSNGIDGLEIVAFRPEQIKSAIGNRGTFDPASPNILYQSGAEPFYSQMQRVLEQKLPGKGTGTDLAALIEKSPAAWGFKQEEMDFSGVVDWLKSQPGIVTKQEVLDYLGANEIQIKEVTHGDEGSIQAGVVRENVGRLEALGYRVNYGESIAEDTKTIESFEKDRVDPMGGREAVTYAAEDGFEGMPDEHRQFAERAAHAILNTNMEGGSSFEQYTLPGAKPGSYRELLLTLPGGQAPEVVPHPTKEGFAVRLPNGRFVGRADSPDALGTMNPDAANNWTARADAEKYGVPFHDTQQFRSSHFDEPNIIAHVRFNERTDADDKRTLFIEEIQSDWHQKGRKEGYRNADDRADSTGWSVTGQRKQDSTTTIYKITKPDGGSFSFPAEPWLTDAQAIEGAAKNVAAGNKRGLVPDAPFKTTWPMLAFKRVLRHAVENGYDAISWTTGEMQAARYDLSKQIDELLVTKNENGTYWLDATLPNDGGKRNIGEGIAADKLAEYVGKDLADTIQKQEGKFEVYDAEDLKVGGEGMKSFYDRELPNEVNRYVKKWGGRVSETQIKTDNAPMSDAEKLRLINQHGTSTPEFDAARTKNSATVHSLPITDSMKAAVQQGQPLFQAENVAAWAHNFPRAAVHTSISAMRQHADYEKAKDGSIDAAERVVADVVNMDAIQSLAKKFPDAIVVPVAAVERSGRNKLPHALAAAFSAMGGLETDGRIIQTNVVSHTNASAAERILKRAVFGGPVVAGRPYIIVDDVITQGGSISELRHYIEKNGGTVVAVSTLAAAKFSTQIAVTNKSVKLLAHKFGRAPFEALLRDYDIAGTIEALTESEARYLGSFSSIDSIRARFVATGISGGAGSRERVFQQAQNLAQDDGSGKARARIEFTTDGGARIVLTPDMDMSSILHEFGHLWLDELITDATTEGTSPQLRVDLDTMLKHFGLTVRSENGAEAIRKAVGRAQHELFATSIEAYFREGKAPSSELRAAFRRFKSWLLAIYQDIQQLVRNGYTQPLNDDVRAVFDRLLATQEQIEAARAEAAVEPMLPFAEMRRLGMSEARLKQYAGVLEAAKEKLGASALAALWRKSKKAYRLALREARKEVDAETRTDKGYEAIEILRNGKSLGINELPPGLVGLKLRKADLVERYGEEFTKRLTGMYSEEGQSADYAAMLLGYESGDLLVKDLASRPPRKDYIKSEATRRTEERYPDPMLDGSMPERAMAALHNNRLAQAIQSELELLGALTQRGVPDYRVIKEAAKRIVGSKTVRENVPSRYLIAERKASREAAKAAAAGKYAEALVWKRRQAMNAALYSEGNRMVEVAERMRALTKKLRNQDHRKRLAFGGPEYLIALEQMAHVYSYRPLSPGRVQDWQSLRTFIDALQDGMEVTAVSERVMGAVEGKSVRDNRDVTVDEIKELFDAYRNLTHLAGQAGKIRKGNELVAYEDGVASLVTAAEAAIQADKLPVGRRDKGAVRRAKEYVGGLVTNMLRPERMAEELDGGSSGAWHDLWLWPIQTGAKLRATLLNKIGKAVTKLHKSMPKEFYANLDEPVTVLGVTITRATLMGVVVNTGNAGNLQRLTGSGIKGPLGKMEITATDIPTLRAALTDAELAYVQGLWDAVNSLLPDIEAHTRKLSGVPMEKVQAQEFTVRGKTYRGGYFPIVYDPTRSSQGANQAEADADRIMLGAGVSRAFTSQGYTKGRAARVNAQLLFDYATVLSRHVDEVVTDIAFREPVKHLTKLLRDPRIRELIEERYGKAGMNTLQGQLAYTVSASSTVSGNNAQETRSLRGALAANVAASALGFAVTVTGGNIVSGIIQALPPGRAGVRGLARGLWNAWTNRFDSTAIIKDKSAFMQAELESWDYAYEKAMNRLNNVRGYRSAAMRVLMAVHRVAQNELSRAIWFGSYLNEVERTGDETAAARFADGVIRQTQVARDRHDLATIERDPMFRDAMMFMAPMLVQFGALHSTARGRGVTRTIGTRIATWLLLGVLAPSAFLLAAGRWPDDGEDDELDAGDWAFWLAKNALLFPVQTLPMIGTVANMIESAVSGNQVNPRAAPAAQAAGGMVKASMAMYRDIDKWSDDGEIDYLEMTSDLVNLVSPIAGLPASQYRRTSQGVEAIMEGDDEAANIGFVKLLIYGPEKP